jgi:hypothetical protein
MAAIVAHEGQVVVPGDKLGSADMLQCGHGCYMAGPYVYASVVGTVAVQSGQGEEAKPCVAVMRRKDRFAPVVPSTNSIVIAKVKFLPSFVSQLCAHGPQSVMIGFFLVFVCVSFLFCASFLVSDVTNTLKRIHHHKHTHGRIADHTCAIYMHLYMCTRIH